MTVYRFEALYGDSGWIEPAFVTTDDKGLLLSISSEGPKGEVPIESIQGWAIPGFINCHSHSFQFKMAGLTEFTPKGQQRDTFWNWREKMYEVALKISPDEQREIAQNLYRALLRHGYTHVIEFHYLHHDPNGKPYDSITAMGESLCHAAQEAGIGITLLPIFYQRGGFDSPAEQKQIRFLSKTVGDYLKLVEATGKMIQHYPNARMGVGVHSLRAVSFPDLKQLVSVVDSDLPFHLHISEQKAEVEQAMKYLKERPVAWFLKNFPVNDRFNFVHAIHLNDEETAALAKSSATVVLCPSTEGNLGDGFFNLKKYWELGGHWTIGTDSHVGLNPFEELRWLDYGARMRHGERNVLCLSPGRESGNEAIREAILSGKRARGELKPKLFCEGKGFDAVVIRSALLSSVPKEHRLSAIVYTQDVSCILGTVVQGRWRLSKDLQ